MRELRGREPERDQLHRLVAALARGRGGVALVDGEPGIGKSRLLHEAGTLARDAGCGVVTAEADEILAGRPFALLIDAFGLRVGAADPEPAAIAQMLEPAYRGQPELEFVIVDRIADLVERLAAGRPLLFAADDLQWADRSSVRVLLRLSQLATSTPLLILLSRRPAPVPPGLAELWGRLAAGGASRLTLRPLTEAAARAFAADLLGTRLSEPLARHVDRANGNPLFIEELIGALPAGWASPAGLPASVTEAIGARLSWLTEGALQALRTAAVLGSPFRLADLALVGGREVPALLELLREPISLGLLSEQGDRYAFRHDLVRESIYLAMPEPVRAGLHTHAGRELAAAGFDALTVANQLSRGAAPGDPATIEWLERAAAQARPHAPATAVDLLERAVALAAAGTPRHTELLVAQLAARVEAGPLPEAVAAGEALLARYPDPATEARVRHALAEARMAQGRYGDAADQLAALRTGDPGFPADRLAAWHAYTLAWSDPARADSLVDQALSTATDPLAVVFATLADATRQWVRGRFAAAADRSTTATSVLLDQFRLGEPVRLVPPANFLFTARRFDEALQLLAHPLWADRAPHQPLRHMHLASIHYLRGEWDDALASAETIDLVAGEQDRDQGRAVVPWVRALIALGRGQLEAADAELAQAEPLPELRCLQGWLAYARGRREHARQIAAGLRGQLLTGSDRFLTVRPLWPSYLPLCLALDDRATAEEITAVVTELADRAQTPATTAEGLHARGLLDDDPEPLLAALTSYQDTPLRVEQAACQEAAGAALARRQHRDGAIAQLRAAATGYEAMGATRHLARVEAALRRLGVRRGRPGPRTRPATGWHSLTPTERSVAELVGQGLIYRQIGERLFISRRTVETHVANMFGKLGVKSRAELAELARRAGVTQPPGDRG